MGHLSIPTTVLSLLKVGPICAVASVVAKRPASDAKAFAALEAMGTVLVGSVIFHPSVRPAAIDAGAAKGLTVVLAL